MNRREQIERAIEINKLGEYHEEVIEELQELWARSEGLVHIVQLVYTSPTGYSEDRFEAAVVFTSEDRARLFVEWANRTVKEIDEVYRKLTETMTHTKALQKIPIPSPLDHIFPESGWGSDYYHFKYHDEFDLDPTFG